MPEAAEDIRALGGATRPLINHRHEGMYGEPELDVPAYILERDRAETARGLPVTDVFTGR